MKKKVLTFFPYSTIWKFNVQEKSINNTLIKHGYEVDTLVCERFMESSCITLQMQPKRFKNFKTQSDICRDCLKKRNYLQSKEIKSIEIKNKISSGYIDLLNKLNNKSLVNFKYKNFEIGKICASDLILEKKKNSNLFDAKTFSELRKKILICLNLLDTLDKIDSDKYKSVFSTNGIYSVCRLFQLYFEKKKIKTYSVLSSLNFNIDDHEVQVVNNDIKYVEFLKSNWEKIKNYTISREAILRVSGYFKMLSLSLHSHTFSLSKTKINIRKFYNIGPDKKIILITLSSTDELLASLSLNLYGNIKEDRIFKNQILWIKYLFKKFKNKKDIFFILRIHPREYKDFKSHNFYDLMKLKRNIPKNFKFDEPLNKISLYDYMKEINLVLNAWSSAVSEFGCRGIPTISYSRFSRFPLSIDYTFKNKLDYLRKINLALNEKSKIKSEERQIKFFKYIAFLSYYSSVDLKITKIFKVTLANKFTFYLKKIYFSIILKNFSFFFKKKAIVSDTDIKYLKNIIDFDTENFFFAKIRSDKLLSKADEKKIILEELKNF